MASKIIIFDLETSGFRRDDDILQISALYPRTNWIFNNYITPSKPVSPQASRVNGLEAFGNNLFLHGDRVNTVSASRAVKSFIYFLGRFNGPVILLAHNCFSFDCPRLIRLVSEVGMLDRFKAVVQGFADSLLIFKEKLPCMVQERRRFSIKALAAIFLDNFDYGSLHNAVNDVKTLSELINAIGVDKNTIIRNSRNISNILKEMKRREIIKDNRCSLSEYEGTTSNYILMKMAKNGINKEILLDTFDEEGEDGIMRLFTEYVNGKPRVTNSRRLVHRFLNYHF
ncbi:maternal protein exuperantia-like [Trichogramma pretiosum]|uniref:maternal protein exuperantia-like n=1 Tax=Trichogramma pretiosum TaxID=7493 RepID=UPI0006C99A04|nr:maternal protein exuperantia-like [Trichogramma pretiosum]